MSRLEVLALTGACLAACTAPPDEYETCTLSAPVDGVRTLTCGDETVSLDAASCRLSAHTDGTATLLCGDVSIDVTLAGATTPLERVVGNVTLENSFDAAQYAGVKEITGTVTVPDVIGLESLELPSLEKIGGYLEVSAQTSMRRLSFPKLASVVGVHIGYGQAFEEFSAPELVTIDENFDFDGGAKVRSFVLPRLATVGQGITLRNIDASEAATLTFGGLTSVREVQLSQIATGITVAFPNLVDGGRLMFASGGGLPSMPKLRTTTSLEFQSGSGGFETIEFPLLETITATEGYALIVQNMNGVRTLRLPSVGAIKGRFAIDSNPDLETLEVGLTSLDSEGDLALNPSLVSARLPTLASITGSLDVYGNPLLTTFEAPLLRSVTGEFSIHDNAALSQCTVDGLSDALTTGAIDSTGNLACDR